MFLAWQDILRAVVDALEGCRAPIVLDTVMVAKSGDRLLHAGAVRRARAYATGVIRTAGELSVGTGEAHGPLHHFHMQGR